MGKNTLDINSQILKRLNNLSRNLWWSWNPPAQAIFAELSPLTWEISNHNPVAVMSQFSESELRARLGNKEFLRRLISVLNTFDQYMKQRQRCNPKDFGRKKIGLVAYFCAEFGVHECLPFYSGGLGVLAGDHIKSASDIGIPIVGVGLFYRQGYFQQRIDSSGNQYENYPIIDPSLLPVELVKDKDGKTVLCSVTIGNNVVYFQGWRVNVGKSIIYLLDTDVPQNEDQFRGLTSLAYGGDTHTRIRQEIVLGIGGIRFLRTLGIKPVVYHMNDGHAAFLTLELMRELLCKEISKRVAEEMVLNKCIFTTHTPVPAGHDRFPSDVIEFNFHLYADSMRLSMQEFMKYGQDQRVNHDNHFSMTALAIRFSRTVNCVSQRHCITTRIMFKDLFSQMNKDKNQIGYITNGVHMPSWTSPVSYEFWERHNSHKWKTHLYHPKFWKHVANPNVVSDEELWALRCILRRELVEFIRQKARQHGIIGGFSSEESLTKLLSPDALTIGFARRFAPYKRAHLIFSDISKAISLFSDPRHPIQIIFAGKAHPRDGEGKYLLRQIIEKTREHPFFGKVIFIENYDMNIARHLVSGCDVWLNTPRRPLEASGTSGQKVAINCGLHVSILDGWWYEAYNGENGWAIGKNKDSHLSQEEIDRQDIEALYHVLNNHVIPMFYDRDRYGLPRKWIARIRNSMRTIIPIYNTHRMLMEYAKKYYYPK